MTLTRSDEAPQWAFWLAIVGLVLSTFTLVALVLCIPMLAFMFTPPYADTETH